MAGMHRIGHAIAHAGGESNVEAGAADPVRPPGNAMARAAGYNCNPHLLPELRCFPVLT